VRSEGLPPLVLDCGTGARLLGVKLVTEPARELDLLFTHFHMDHVFGFPFFAPIYTPGYEVRIVVPAFSEEEAQERLARYLNGVYHPTRLRELPAKLSFHAIRPGRDLDLVSGWHVRTAALNHPGGATAYRIEQGGRSIAYVTDTAPFARPDEGVTAGKPSPVAERRVIDFLRDCDCVVYDTMFDHEEYLVKMTWGHSYPEYAWSLCNAAGVKHLVLFHHLPDATDDMLDELEKHWSNAESPRVTLAREGATLAVGGP
jgi:phosphoribosyl 1,2-cyclic phosphodiesterase